MAWHTFIKTKKMSAIWFHERLEGPSLITENVFLGDRGDSHSRETLTEHNIGTVISLLDASERTEKEVALYKELGIEWFHFQLHDEEDAPIIDYLECINQLINQFTKPHRSKPTVLVHCQAGISRSATAVIYYLMRSHGFALKQAVAHVKDCRPVIEPNDGFMSTLQDADISQQLKKLN
jgi:dual specificity phosphatase 12